MGEGKAQTKNPAGVQEPRLAHLASRRVPRLRPEPIQPFVADPNLQGQPDHVGRRTEGSQRLVQSPPLYSHLDSTDLPFSRRVVPLSEQQRLANIKANDDLLRSLGIAAGNSTSSLGIPVKKRASSPPAKKAPRPKKVKTEPSAIPARRSSARLLGIQADSETLKIKLDEEERELKEMKEAKRRATHGPYSLDNLPEPIPKADLSALTSTLASTSSSVAGLSSTGEAKSQAAGVAELRQKFSSMAIKKYAKVTSDRVFSMVIHPDPTKTLVFVGDKTGQLGIWDPLAEKDDKDDEEGEEGEDHEGKHWRIQAHGSSSVSCIKVSPSDHTKVRALLSRTLTSALTTPLLPCLPSSFAAVHKLVRLHDPPALAFHPKVNRGLFDPRLRLPHLVLRPHARRSVALGERQARGVESPGFARGRGRGETEEVGGGRGDQDGCC